MKTTRARLTLVSLLPAALLVAACGADTADPALGAVRGPLHASDAPRAHLMPMPGARHFVGMAGNGNVHVTYRGGPVISNVKVFTVFWDSTVPNQSALGTFYGTVTDSPYVDWLAEYDTPTQNIGRGKFVGTYVDPSPPSSSDLSDDDVQQELAKLVDAGKLPQPDGDTLFMVHFPAGVTITLSGSTSCQQFCAYHSSFTHGSGTVYYGILPDFSGACASCGGEATQFDSTTVVSAHELVEAMTDPNIGVANATNDEHDLGWYDDQNDEIADPCEGQSATVAGYRVTKAWSNHAGACIATGTAGGTGGGGTGGAGTGGSGTGGGGTGAGGTGGGGTGGGGGGTCDHGVCSVGGPLDGSCDPCAAKVCKSESSCCSTGWTHHCVSAAKSICHQHCGGGHPSTCAHSLCEPGAPLSPTCSSCTSQVCSYAPQCCFGAWEPPCVEMAVAFCGQQCP